MGVHSSGITEQIVQLCEDVFVLRMRILENVPKFAAVKMLPDYVFSRQGLCILVV